MFKLYIVFVFAIRKEAGDFIANKLFSVPDSVSPIGSVVQKHRRAPFYKKTPVAAASVGMFFSQVVSWYSQWTMVHMVVVMHVHLRCVYVWWQ